MNKLTILFLLCLYSCKQTNTTAVQSSDHQLYTQELKEYFQSLTALERFNGAVLVKQEGHTLLYQEFNLDQDTLMSLHCDPQSQFDIHSISKLMAKACIVDLESEGLVSRQDPIAKYITTFPNGDNITIQHLLDNQSGLPRELSTERDDIVNLDPKALVDLIMDEQLRFEPGTESGYSNLGYQVLYYIISLITEQPFVQYLDEVYFKPLNMINTGAHFYLSKDNKDHLVTNHELDDDGIVVVPSIQGRDKNQAKLYSNINDLSLFLDHIKTQRYIDQLTNKGRNTVGWSGGGDGILSHIEYNIAGNYDLLFYSNYDEIPFGDIVLTVEKIMTKQPYDLPRLYDRQEMSIPTQTLDTYVGKYRMREFNNSLFEFKREDSQLVFYQDGVRNTVLKAETEDTFFELPTDEDYFKFQEAVDGNIEVVYYYKKVPIVGHRE